MKATNLPGGLFQKKDVRKTHRSGDQSLETSSCIVAVVQSEASLVSKNLFVTCVLISYVSVPSGVCLLLIPAPEGSLPIHAHSASSSPLLPQNIQFQSVALFLPAEDALLWCTNVTGYCGSWLKPYLESLSDGIGECMCSSWSHETCVVARICAGYNNDVNHPTV